MLSGVTTEGWAFLTTIFLALSSGVGYLAKTWVDRKVGTQIEANARLAETQDRLIAAAEEREKIGREDVNRANARMEEALKGLGHLTGVLADLSAVAKSTLEECRRVNANYEGILRERDRDRRN